jgi:hypothetical protein
MLNGTIDSWGLKSIGFDIKTNIGNLKFSGCKNLTDITFFNTSLSSFSSSNFEHCQSLRNIWFPKADGSFTFAISASSSTQLGDTMPDGNIYFNSSASDKIDTAFSSMKNAGLNSN